MLALSGLVLRRRKKWSADVAGRRKWDVGEGGYVPRAAARLGGSAGVKAVQRL